MSELSGRTKKKVTLTFKVYLNVTRSSFAGTIYSTSKDLWAETAAFFRASMIFVFVIEPCHLKLC